MRSFTKYLLSAALVLPVLLTLNSCEKTNPTNPIVGSTIYYQYYMVKYDKDSNTTDAKAQFRTDGENGYIHTLVDHESLNINRNLAAYNPATREYTFSANKMINVDFILTKNAGKQYQNIIRTIDTSDVSFPPIFPSSINRNTGQTIDWDGREINDSTERFFMIIDDLVNPPVYKEYANGKWSFGSGDLLHLNPGEVYMRLELQKTMDLQQTDSSGSGRIEVIVRTSKKISLF
jgi:hypothetical protein